LGFVKVQGVRPEAKERGDTVAFSGLLEAYIGMQYTELYTESCHNMMFSGTTVLSTLSNPSGTPQGLIQVLEGHLGFKTKILKVVRIRILAVDIRKLNALA
jgi:hypothetical protein